MLEKYHPDLEYDASIEFVRACWEDALVACIPPESVIASYYFRPPTRSDYELNVQAQFHKYIEEDQKRIAQEIWEASPEYKAAHEGERLQKEKLDAEWEVNMAVWEANQLRRRQHDMDVSQKGRLNVAALCYEAEDYHSEFFGQFFSKEYCGWNVEYDPIWKGYQFQKEVGGYSTLLFSTTGTLFRTDGSEKGEMVPEWNYVMTYGHLVCGYPVNSMDHLSPNNYRKAVHGFAAWLKEEKGKRDGSVVEYGTFNYWKQLFEGVILAVFGNELEKEECTDAPRNIFRLVAARWSEEERAPFPELVDEKAFRTFLRDCCEGGEHCKRASYYFKTEGIRQDHTEKFKLTFNPKCIPPPELTPEQKKMAEEHLTELMMRCGLLHHSDDEFYSGSGDPNFDAEAEAEYQNEAPED
jgi:hypothetical protein